ncbi:hypothetical protein ABW16_08970 [Mycolicibacter heraklionensis]|uniref:MalT-like TPR region domain-containing protein n=1 Tax=Mycolicibacter heraklionensis TaxID=512402 RepID=A0ABR5FGY5_9MYCO|nr:hypothetical protein [Mycolicibacter heraklionensis]KLO29736.1 hypothetical protein ABW16_08970 [Mycolicibacter heraklionensis]
MLARVDSIDNPSLRCIALLAYGLAHRVTDPPSALDALRRGLEIAQQSGNEWAESHLAASLSRTAVTGGKSADAFEYLELAIRNFSDAGNFSLMNTSLAIPAGVLDKLGHYEPAATINVCAAYLWTRTANLEINTRSTICAGYSAIRRTKSSPRPAGT